MQPLRSVCLSGFAFLQVSLQRNSLERIQERDVNRSSTSRAAGFPCRNYLNS